MFRLLSFAALAATAGTGVAQAQIAVGGSIGTTGGAVEAQVRISDYLQVRGGYNYLEFGVDDEYDGVAYDGDLGLKAWGAFVDAHPFNNAFLVTAGAYIGDKGLDSSATPTSNVQIGSTNYTPAQVGTLNLSTELEDAAPFVGIGWDNTFFNDGPWGFKVILGAMYTGSPEISLTSSGGSLSNNTAFQQQLAQEEANLEDDVNDYEYYPVLQVGLTFAF